MDMDIDDPQSHTNRRPEEDEVVRLKKLLTNVLTRYNQETAQCSLELAQLREAMRVATETNDRLQRRVHMSWGHYDHLRHLLSVVEEERNLLLRENKVLVNRVDRQKVVMRELVVKLSTRPGGQRNWVDSSSSSDSDGDDICRDNQGSTTAPCTTTTTTTKRRHVVTDDIRTEQEEREEAQRKRKVRRLYETPDLTVAEADRDDAEKEYIEWIQGDRHTGAKQLQLKLAMDRVTFRLDAAIDYTTELRKGIHMPCPESSDQRCHAVGLNLIKQILNYYARVRHVSLTDSELVILKADVNDKSLNIHCCTVEQNIHDKYTEAEVLRHLFKHTPSDRLLMSLDAQTMLDQLIQLLTTVKSDVDGSTQQQQQQQQQSPGNIALILDDIKHERLPLDRYCFRCSGLCKTPTMITTDADRIVFCHAVCYMLSGLQQQQ